MRNMLISVKAKNAVLTAFGLVLCAVLLISCGGNRGTGTAENFENLEQLTGDGRFAIEHEWALPMRGSMIDLIGNTNFIRFQGDSVNLFLPYFGVRQSGGGYGSEGGLEYEGLAENLSLKKSSKGNSMILKFEADRGTENLDFIITLFADGTANTSVTSSQIDPISYRGHIRELQKEEEF